jgi:hypothetical protein
MFKLFFIILFTTLLLRAQDGGDIFLIDSYITPEIPHEIKILFYTNDSVKSKIIFNKKDEFVVSSEYATEHFFQLPLKKLKSDSSSIPFEISVETQSGKRYKGDIYDLYLPEDYELNMEDESAFVNLCVGTFLYLLPMPTYFFDNNSSNFALLKELPVVAFYNGGYNYPNGYIAVEYSYVFEKNSPNFLRIGYKHIFQTNTIKYISFGVNYTTDFNGFNGISPEISLGLFEFYDTFTFYFRYRFNVKPSSDFENFHEISIGLFTSVFSFNY